MAVVKGATPLAVMERITDFVSFSVGLMWEGGGREGDLLCLSSLHYSVKLCRKALPDRLTPESCRFHTGKNSFMCN